MALKEQELTSSEENPYVTMFENFFDTIYRREIEKLVESYPQKRSLDVDFKKLEKFDFELADDLIENPDYLQEAAQAAIKKIDVPALGLEDFSPHIRFYNLPKDRQPLIRDVSASHLNKMIAVEGIIREITDVLPKLKVALWQCRRCGNTYKTPQEGNQIKQPAFCECRHRDFMLVAEKSEFEDHQRIQIQEPLEQLRGSEQASQLDIYATDDLVNRVSAGNKTKFVGVLRLSELKGKKALYGRYLEAIHLEDTQKEFEDVEITPEEAAEIKALSNDPKVYDKLIQSLAPSIYGHEIVKEAIVMQLFGGVKKNLPDETHIRGNIHVLLVGDPGAAKSMMLLATNNIAPKSIYVSGKMATGAGIAATAVKDEFGEGGWTLKAGALVLASGGLAAIDEFDKMDPDDRSALHEALEQQTVSVAKAGIIARFKTETSVLAAANPKFARFDPYMSFMEQLNLPPTLVSRFDLFFMIKDVLDRTKDAEIATHILRSHRTGEMISRSKRPGHISEKQELQEMENIITPPISPALFRKYISYTRQNIFPVLSDEAMKTISDFYVNLRDLGKKEGSYSATHRQLEALVRLSEASARVRLSNVVEMQDAERAIRLLRTSLQDVVTDPETGKIDYDIIATGQSHSKVAAMKKVLSIIREKALEIDMVPINDVLEEAKSQGIDKDKAMDIINQLQREGEIYKPRNNFLKPTQGQI